MHSFVATRMYEKITGKKQKVTSKEPFVWVDNVKVNARQKAKAVNLGLDYGKSAYTLKEDLLCSQEEAQNFIDLIKGLFPRKEKYTKHKYLQSIENGYVLMNNLTGRRSYIPFFEESKKLIEEGNNGFITNKERRKRYYVTKGAIERMCMNYPIQGTAADIMKLASYLVYRHIHRKGYDAWFVNVVHDEVNIICKKDQTEKLIKESRRIMERAANIFCKSVPFPVEFTVADHWSK